MNGLAVADIDAAAFNGVDFIFMATTPHAVVPPNEQGKPATVLLRRTGVGLDTTTERYVAAPYTPSGVPAPAMDVVVSRFKNSQARPDVDVVATLPNGALWVLWNTNGVLTTYDPNDPNKSGYQPQQPVIKSPSIAAGQFRVGDIRDVVRTDHYELPPPPSSSRAWVSRNNDNAVFSQLPTPSLPGPFWEPYGVATGKLNADNLVDIVYTSAHGREDNWPDVDGAVRMVAQLDALPTFDWANVKSFYVEDADDPFGKPCFVQVGDLNKDGWADVAVSCTQNGRVCVLLNNLNGPPPG